MNEYLLPVVSIVRGVKTVISEKNREITSSSSRLHFKETLCGSNHLVEDFSTSKLKRLKFSVYKVMSVALLALLIDLN